MTAEGITATQYNTYCEVFTHYPVLSYKNVTNARGRSGYIAIDTLIVTADNQLEPATLTAYWPDSRPALKAILYGPGMIANDTTRLEIAIERLQVETRPGEPHSPEYRKTHFQNTPCRVRAFGRVISRTASTFTISGQTFLIGGSSRFTVICVVHSPDHLTNIPAVGTFAGGAGTLKAAPKTPAQLVVQLDTMHIGTAGAATQTAGAVAAVNNATEWFEAMNHEQVAANNPPLAIEPPTGPPLVQLTTLNSYCETNHRFPLFQTQEIGGRYFVQSKTITPDSNIHQFFITSASPFAADPHSIVTAAANVALDERQLHLGSSPANMIACRGNPQDPNYKSQHMFKQPFRLRAAGRVTASADSEFSVAAVVDIGGRQMPVVILFLVPTGEKAGPRWTSFPPPAVGSFASGRGYVERILYGAEPKIVVTLESAANPISNASVIPLTQTAAAGQEWMDAWSSDTEGSTPSAAGASSAAYSQNGPPLMTPQALPLSSLTGHAPVTTPINSYSASHTTPAPQTPHNLFPMSTFAHLGADLYTPFTPSNAEARSNGRGARSTSMAPFSPTPGYPSHHPNSLPGGPGIARPSTAASGMSGTHGGNTYMPPFLGSLAFGTQQQGTMPQSFISSSATAFDTFGPHATTPQRTPASAPTPSYTPSVLPTGQASLQSPSPIPRAPTRSSTVIGSSSGGRDSFSATHNDAASLIEDHPAPSTGKRARSSNAKEPANKRRNGKGKERAMDDDEE